MVNEKILDEYNTVKNNVGLFDFSIEGKIIIKGEGRIDFINGIVSNDVKNLENFNGVYAAFLDRFGKVLTDCIIYKFQDYLLINANIIGRKNIIEKLTNEAKLADSWTEDATLKYALFSLQGPKSLELINDILNSKVELRSQYQSIIIKSKDNETEIIITKNNRTNYEGYDIFVPAPDYKEFKQLIIDKGKDYNLKIINNETYDILRLEAKIPLYGVDFDENNILPEITEKAVSYEKGCFVGQEVVARVKSLAKGATAKKLVSLEIDSKDIPQKNTKIMKDEKEAGYVTSAAFSPKLNKVVALGLLDRGFYENDADFEIGIWDKKSICRKISFI